VLWRGAGSGINFKHMTTMNPHTGKHVSRLNKTSEWMSREVPQLRIVPDDLWTAAKSRQKQTRHVMKTAGDGPPKVTALAQALEQPEARSQAHEVAGLWALDSAHAWKLNPAARLPPRSSTCSRRCPCVRWPFVDVAANIPPPGSSRGSTGRARRRRPGPRAEVRLRTGTPERSNHGCGPSRSSATDKVHRSRSRALDDPVAARPGCPRPPDWMAH
jgi:hypothetical protein